MAAPATGIRADRISLAPGGGETNIVVGTTITGDFMCRASNVDYRMDTSSAQAFLGHYVTLP
jgi:hypothetical protein